MVLSKKEREAETLPELWFNNEVAKAKRAAKEAMIKRLELEKNAEAILRDLNPDKRVPFSEIDASRLDGIRNNPELYERLLRNDDFRKRAEKLDQEIANALHEVTAAEEKAAFQAALNMPEHLRAEKFRTGLLNLLKARGVLSDDEIENSEWNKL